MCSYNGINEILVRLFVYRLPRVRACLCAIAAPCVLLCVCDACTCDAACVCAIVYVRVRMCCCVFANAEAGVRYSLTDVVRMLLPHTHMSYEGLNSLFKYHLGLKWTKVL